MAQSGKTVELCDAQDAEGTPDQYANQVCTAGVVQCDSACTPRAPAGGYGTNITNEDVTLFADAIVMTAEDRYHFNLGEELANVRLDIPANINISTATESDQQTIVFAPPDGAVFIDGVSAVGEFSLNVQHTKITVPRTVIIRPASGRIDVE